MPVPSACGLQTPLFSSSFLSSKANFAVLSSSFSCLSSVGGLAAPVPSAFGSVDTLFLSSSLLSEASCAVPAPQFCSSFFVGGLAANVL